MTERSTNRVRRMRIHNFQALADVEVEFGDLTVVRGASDVGKSALVRAFSAVLTNSLTREQVRSGETFARIAIETDAGEVALIRDGKDLKEVRYEIRLPDGTERAHTKCNKEVPAEVADILGIQAVKLDEDVEVMPNISTQFGGQFPLDQPPSVISKLLGRVSNLNVVFAALRLVEAEDRETGTRVAAAEQIVAEKKASAAMFASLPERRAAVACVEEADESASEREALREQAAALVVDLQQTGAQVEVLEAKAAAAELVVGASAELAKAVQELVAGRTELEQVRALEDGIRTLTEKAEAATSVGAMQVDTAGLREAHELVRSLRELRAAVDRNAVAAEAAAALVEACPTPESSTEPAQLHAELSRIRGVHNSMVKEAKEALGRAAELELAVKRMVDGMDLCPLIKDVWRDGCREKVGGL